MQLYLPYILWWVFQAHGDLENLNTGCSIRAIWDKISIYNVKIQNTTIIKYLLNVFTEKQIGIFVACDLIKCGNWLLFH